MKTPAFARVSVLPLALFCGAVLAQQAPATRIDTAPLPAEDRASAGTIELRNEPVLAKRRYLEQLAGRAEPDTRTMGAGPARVLRRLEAGDAVRLQRALEEAEDRGGDIKAP
jgi:hypothetical protein